MACYAQLESDPHSRENSTPKPEFISPQSIIIIVSSFQHASDPPRLLQNPV